MPATGAVMTALTESGVHEAPFGASTSSQQQSGTATGAPGEGMSNSQATPSAAGTGAYVAAYLAERMSSMPSYRYAYLFWVIIGGMALAYAVCHHLRLSGGSVGASFSKWSMRRVTIGPSTHRRAVTLPANGAIVVATAVVAAAIMLSLLGDDFIKPTTGVWDFSTSVVKRFDKSAIPQHNIGKAWWTMGNRFGFMAFAILPLVVLLAVKAPPFAIFSIRPFTHLYSDKLIRFHFLAGWLAWILATAHVALWTVQLFKDSYNGRVMWLNVFLAYRFIMGCVAYAIMTLLMVMSLRPVRKYRFEFFYIAHVTLVLLFLVFSVLHHPAIWWWIAAALGIWAGDRLVRAVRYAVINSGAAKPVSGTGSYAGLATDDIALEEFTDKMLSNDAGEEISAELSPTLHSSPLLGFDGYAEAEILPTGTWESSYASLYDAPQTRRPSGRQRRRVTPTQNDIAAAFALPGPPPIPRGFAQAQLLPSRTIRLTIRPPRHVKWSAGQYLHLTLPELSRFQSHPFTITNADCQDEMVVMIKARKGITRKLYDHVRQRMERSLLITDKDGAEAPRAAPVYLRAMVDVPFGSAGRVRWGDFSTVLIVCGGSGVTFGLAVCDYVTRAIQAAKAGSKTRRVRFVWVAREYAEIAWAASALCRAQQLVTESQLQIDIHVTNANPAKKIAQYDNYHSRLQRFGMKRTVSDDSVLSNMSQDFSEDGGDADDIDDEMLAAATTLLELTNFSSDEDVDDPEEAELSRQMQRQGKKQRARTRKDARQAEDFRRSMDEAAASYRPAQGDSYAVNMRSPVRTRTASGSSVPALPPGAAPPTPRGRNSYYHAYSDSMDESATSQDANVLEHGQSLSEDGRGATSAGDLSRHTSQRRSRRSNSRDRPGLYNERRRPSQGHNTRLSSASSTYDRCDPYNGGDTGMSPSPSAVFSDADSTLSAVSVLSRTGSMVRLDEPDGEPIRRKKGKGDRTGPPVGLWIDEADYAAMVILSEQARAGRPQLAKIMEEELERAEGSMIVAMCGPEKLNTVVRNLVSRSIQPGKIFRGDKRGHVAIYSEDFES